MVTGKVQHVQSFFYSQAFADGLRASFAILVPALIGHYTGYFELGLSISLGAMCVSLTDAPGPFEHKKNGMLACSAFLFVVAFITPFARTDTFLMGLEIVAVCFFFSMFSVYGSRAGGVGSAAILVMIISMDKPVPVAQILPQAALVLSGGLYYTALSLSLYMLRPYRIAERALGDCIREIAVYLSVKADFYDPTTSLSSDYSRMLARQIIVHEKQDAVRELLFKSREIVEESTLTGRRLVMIFVETVDLFENITATYYDYELLRKQYGESGVLEKIGKTLKIISAELDSMGVSIQSRTRFNKHLDYDHQVIYLKNEIDVLEAAGLSTRVLKRILVNIRRILSNFQAMQEYLQTEELPSTRVDHSPFISHQSFTPKIFWDNLGFSSSVFRHALRVSLACIAGYAIARIISYGHHSYWILLTIAFILKPAYSLTKERNLQRILGTVAGGIIGVLIFILIPDATIQFILMVLFMIATYTFMRMNYLVMVICTTPYVLLLFKFLGVGFIELAGERIIDTAIGCAIAFSASYFLFPSWEADYFRLHMKNMLEANLNYLTKVADVLRGRPVTATDYKLSRKAVYVAAANLSGAFQRMLSEPKSLQGRRKNIYQFVVLNHVLFSNIASVATTVFQQKQRDYSHQLFLAAKRSRRKLKEALAKFDAVSPMAEESPVTAHGDALQPGERALKEQLEFIERLAGDIQKLTAGITEETTV
jgi:uncharacterized membrane protein (TIGR01666 family)